MPAEPAHPAASARAARWGLRSIALVYLLFLLVLPGRPGALALFDTASTPSGSPSPARRRSTPCGLTILITAIAVPLNAIFGSPPRSSWCAAGCRAAPSSAPSSTCPSALSPVVVGLCVVLVWGKYGLVRLRARTHWGCQVVFAVPGMVLATIFVCLPFVVREVVPVLREVGTDQEEAASILGAGGFQTFWRITLPAIRWGVIYGVVLTTARALGEYGAVAVVSGRISGKSETMTLFRGPAISADRG